jgi:hypothetical protein
MYPFPEQIQSALRILGFADGVAPSSLKELNKRYHLLALKHHPDKVATTDGDDGDRDNDRDDNHRTRDATERFKEINDAHKRVKDFFFSNEPGLDDIRMENGYDSILQMFIQTILAKISRGQAAGMGLGHGLGLGYEETTINQAVQSLIHMIITKGLQSAITMFQTMDKQACLTIYDILSKNQDLFGISREILEELTRIVEEKMGDDLVVRLNPSLLDMLLDRVYILHEYGQTYYIPLWHSELHFKQPAIHGDGEIIVLCDPELPDNVSLDDNNNLFISLDVNILELFRDQVVPVYINDEIKDRGFIYYLHACDVTLRSDTRQCVLLRGLGGSSSGGGVGGIAMMNTNTNTNTNTKSNDIYKVGARASVYANVRLVSGV